MKIYGMKPTFFMFLIALSLLFGCSSDNNPIDQNDLNTLYFPPLNSETWETVSISDLGWNESELQPLLDYLETKNTKSFMILYNGRLSPRRVVEAFVHAHELPADAWGTRRVVNLPGITATVAEMIDAMGRVAGAAVAKRVVWKPPW